MKGIFYRNNKQWLLWSIILAIVGIILSVRFLTWGIPKLTRGKIAASIFCFGFVAIGLLLCALAVFIVTHNRNAKLTVDEQTVSAVYGLKRSFCVKLTEISDVTIYNGALILYLPNRIAQIYGLSNAIEICQYIEGFISKNQNAKDIDAEQEGKKKKTFKRRHQVWYAFLLIDVLLIFGLLFACIIMTGERDISDFSGQDELVFAVFSLLELITAIGFIFFCNKVTRSHFLLLSATKRHLKAMAYQCHEIGLDRYQNIVHVRYFNEDQFRSVVFSPEHDTYCYMTERLDADKREWVAIFEKAKTFESVEQMNAYCAPHPSDESNDK